MEEAFTHSVNDTTVLFTIFQSVLCRRDSMAKLLIPITKESQIASFHNIPPLGEVFFILI